MFTIVFAILLVEIDNDILVILKLKIMFFITSGVFDSINFSAFREIIVGCKRKRYVSNKSSSPFASLKRRDQIQINLKMFEVSYLPLRIVQVSKVIL